MKLLPVLRTNCTPAVIRALIAVACITVSWLKCGLVPAVDTLAGVTVTNVSGQVKWFEMRVLGQYIQPLPKILMQAVLMDRSIPNGAQREHRRPRTHQLLLVLYYFSSPVHRLLINPCISAGSRFIHLLFYKSCFFFFKAAVNWFLNRNSHKFWKMFPGKRSTDSIKL